MAKLAGIPQQILQEASFYLKSLESDSKTNVSHPLHAVPGMLFPVPVEDIKDKANFQKLKMLLEEVDLDKISPLQALQILYKIKGNL